MHKKLNLKKPLSFSEKTQWLKLYDRNPLYTLMVDKYSVKEYVSKLIGERYVIPTIGVWNKFDDIQFDQLPNQFVLKCTHDSGGVVICNNKNNFKYEDAKKKLNGFLKRNYYRQWREWPYKDVKPRIIAEKYMQDKSTGELMDYKFFCFNGVPELLFIASDRQNHNEETKFDFFDMEFNHVKLKNGHPNANVLPKKPKNFELMKELASTLSANIPSVRVDFYEVDGEVYFGELTFSHWSGIIPFEPEHWDYRLGEMIDLPQKH